MYRPCGITNDYSDRPRRIIAHRYAPHAARIRIPYRRSRAGRPNSKRTHFPRRSTGKQNDPPIHANSREFFSFAPIRVHWRIEIFFRAARTMNSIQLHFIGVHRCPSVADSLLPCFYYSASSFGICSSKSFRASTLRRIPFLSIRNIVGMPLMPHSLASGFHCSSGFFLAS